MKKFLLLLVIIYVTVIPANSKSNLYKEKFSLKETYTGLGTTACGASPTASTTYPSTITTPASYPSTTITTAPTTSTITPAPTTYPSTTTPAPTTYPTTTTAPTYPSTTTPAPTTYPSSTITTARTTYPSTTTPAPTTYPSTTITTAPTTYPSTTIIVPSTTYSFISTSEAPITYPSSSNSEEPSSYPSTTTKTAPTTYPNTTTTGAYSPYPSTTTIAPTTYPNTTTTGAYSPYPSTTTIAPTTLYPGTNSTSASITNTTTEYFTTAAPDPENICVSEYSCINCTAVRICAPQVGGQSFREIDRFTCPTYQPWCNSTTGTCTAFELEECFTPTVSTDFTCMRDGYFPDLRDCSKYYQCHQETPLLYTCPPFNPYYSPGDKSCQSHSTDCANASVSCNGLSGVKIKVNFTSNLFVYCVNGSAAAVDRCIGAYRFNTASELCEAACPHAGLFPKDDDCGNYYRCSPRSQVTGSDFIMTDLTCSQGQGFLESAYDCVNRSLVPNCNVPYSGLFNKK